MPEFLLGLLFFIALVVIIGYWLLAWREHAE
jgi:hypothetical protein